MRKIYLTNMKTATALPIRSEYAEQCDFVNWLEDLQAVGKIRLFTANPNNTYTKSWSQKRKMKNEGVRQGYPDMTIITNNCSFFYNQLTL